MATYCFINTDSSPNADENSVPPISVQYRYQWNWKRAKKAYIKLGKEKHEGRKLLIEFYLFPEVTKANERMTKIQACIVLGNANVASLQYYLFKVLVAATLHDPETKTIIGSPEQSCAFFAVGKNSITLQADLARREEVERCTSKKLEIHVEVTVTGSKRLAPAGYQCTEEEAPVECQCTDREDDYVLIQHT